jgi:GLPGLI family protein
MKKIISFILILFITNCIVSAQTSGVINYDIVTNWVKIMSNCKYVSKADIERSSYMWGEREWTQKSTLKYNSKQSLYEILPYENDEGTWSHHKEDYFIYRDLENKRMLNIFTLLDKEYAVEDSIQCIEWKIGNGMKEVAGHICINAFYYDTLREKNIVAWFALDLPVPVGPDGYCGLPGAILELDMNNGSVIYTATIIIPSQDEVSIIQPVIKRKRKVISFTDFQAMEAKLIMENRKQKRPYFWVLKY